MAGNIMLVVERQFDAPRRVLFDAWTRPDELAQWRGSPGWHVEASTVGGDARLGGRHTHVKVVDDDPSVRVTTDGVYTEFFDPDVFVSTERITGDPGIPEDLPLELRVEFLRTGREGTLLRIIQGPYDEAVAYEHSQGWERELGRLQAYLDAHAAAPAGAGVS